MPSVENSRNPQTPATAGTSDTAATAGTSDTAAATAATADTTAPITEQEVRHVARLARIALDESDVEHFTSHLLKVLNQARQLEALDLADVPLWRHPYGLKNVLREDRIEQSQLLDLPAVLSQAPAVEDRFFKVPPVLGEAP